MPDRDSRDAQPTDDELRAAQQRDLEQAPADADADADAASAAADEPREVRATVTRQARIGRFLGVGAIVGLLLALVLSMLWPSDPNYVPENPSLNFSDLQVFGFLAVYLVPICLGIAGLIGYLLGRAAERRNHADVVLERDAA